jgi:hypothetical protein
MAANPGHCAACSREGETYVHALVRGGAHYPSVWLCGGCLAVVTTAGPDSARTAAKPARTRSRPPAESLSPMVDDARSASPGSMLRPA